jgi:hypothetical protein
MTENIQQALQLATTSTQLTILPTFSNDPKEDKISTTQWLHQLKNNKQGDGWTDVQVVTLFKHALREEVLK